MHSYFALKQGYQVTLIERDPRPLSASVRNFGMIAVGGRAAGTELSHALRARELWGEIAAEHSELTFRPSGSVVVALNDNHLEVMHEIANYPDASQRGWQVLDQQSAREVNPGLRGSIAGGLYCSQDAVVEPNLVLDQLRQVLFGNPLFTFLAGQEVVAVGQQASEVSVTLRNGTQLTGDYAIVVPGANHSDLFAQELAKQPLRRVFLQMARLENPGFELTTSIASFDSLRFYPGYQGAPLERLEPVRPLVQEMVMQLLLQQRIDGTLTMGDTHIYDEPFPHEMREDCYELLRDDVEDIIGVRPKVLTRWQGIYSQNTSGEVCIRVRPDSRIHLVTGPGGRGNTLSPVIAEQTIRELDD
jgi:FAD dependent oxidoreductase TIGR03364